MKIKITVSMGLVGCRRERTIEIDDGLTEEQIDEQVKEEVLGSEMVTWSWSKQP